MIHRIILSATEITVNYDKAKAFFHSLAFWCGVFFIFLIIVMISAGFYIILRDIFYKREGEENVKVVFDPKISELKAGSLSVTIPIDTMEYYVCKTIFKKSGAYHSDLDIEETANQHGDGRDFIDRRTIYQAVNRVNKKAKKSLDIKEDLIERSNQKSILNKKYTR